jgi:metallophosphoesterase (TIGR00282 family)
MNREPINILLVGDVVGEPGRTLLARRLPGIVDEHQIHLTIVNGENAAGGFGITPKIADDLFRIGVHVITTGNHVWDKKEIVEYLVKDARLLRPANYPEIAPGSGSVVVDLDKGHRVAVLHLMGRVFMPDSDCPFQVGKREIQFLKKQTPVIVVDMHGEATSEKRAMGWYLDGEVTAVLGTHTHVQTADETILPQGTAYITDVGMTGPYESVIGIKKEMAVTKFLNQMPARFEVAGGPSMIAAVVVQADPESGRALGIKRLQIKEAASGGGE